MINDMGRSLSVHRGQFSAGAILWYVGGLCGLGSVVGIVQSLLGKGASGGLAVGIAGLLVSLAALAIAYSRWKQVLEIFEGGFVLVRPLGSHTASRGEVGEVAVVTHTARRSSYTELTIELTSGKTISVRGIEEMEQAANLLAGPAAKPSPSASAAWRPPAPPAASQSGRTPPGGAK